jgi:hypothetical protein
MEGSGKRSAEGEPAAAEQQQDEDQQQEEGPPRPPPEDLEEEPDVGPAPPKAKKRKVRRGGARRRAVPSVRRSGPRLGASQRGPGGAAPRAPCLAAQAAPTDRQRLRPAAWRPLRPAPCHPAVAFAPPTFPSAARPSSCPYLQCTRCKQVLQFEQQYLDALPSAQMYEKSYMHRDTLSHVVVGANGGKGGRRPGSGRPKQQGARRWR